MQNFEYLDVFEILITQKLLQCPKDPFVRSALINKSTYNRSECPYSVFEHLDTVSKQKPHDYPPCILYVTICVRMG